MAVDLERAAAADDEILFAAVVRVPIAPMHAEPRVASQMVSQQLAGHRVDIVDEEGEWLRARGADDYEGWIHRGFLSRAPGRTARQSRQASRVSLGCVTRTPGGDRRALPLRALLSPDETVSEGEAIDVAELRRRFPSAGAAIARTAVECFAGASYLWGGVTPWGADCSGLVQSVFALHGVTLPRDAWQQAELGDAAGTVTAALQPADLLFFSDRDDGRVTHVGIAVGDARMVHLSLGRGGYAVDRMDDASDAYTARLRDRFLFARRLIAP